MAYDLYYYNTVALLHGNGADGSTVFTDDSQYARAFTFQGNPHIVTTVSKFNGSSIYFDGVGDRLVAGASADWNLGNTYTVEFFLYPLAMPGAGNNCRVVMIGVNNTASSAYLCFSQTGSLSMGVALGTAIPAATGVGVVTTDGFHHYAVSVDAGVGRVFKDGTLVGGPTAGVTTQSVVATDPLYIGYDTVGTVNFNFNGYLAEFRITKGVCRYKENFVAPAAPLSQIPFYFSGVARDDLGNPCSRKVFAIARDTGELLGSAVSDAGTGAFNITPTRVTPTAFVYLDDLLGVSYNALIRDKIIPV